MTTPPPFPTVGPPPSPSPPSGDPLPSAATHLQQTPSPPCTTTLNSPPSSPSLALSPSTTPPTATTFGKTIPPPSPPCTTDSARRPLLHARQANDNSGQPRLLFLAVDLLMPEHCLPRHPPPSISHNADRCRSLHRRPRVQDQPAKPPVLVPPPLPVLPTATPCKSQIPPCRDAYATVRSHAKTPVPSSPIFLYTEPSSSRTPSSSYAGNVPAEHRLPWHHPRRAISMSLLPRSQADHLLR